MIRVLDPFGGAGAGGAAKGYGDLGWKVIGGDIAPQPDYPYEFHQGDAIEMIARLAGEVDIIHLSPPCQRYNALTAGTNRRLKDTYADLYGPAKAAAEATGLPYVIENPAARPDMVLCGEMFGLRVIRHRKFELGGWTATAPEEPAHRGLVIGMRHGKRITEAEGGYYYAVYGNGGYKGTVAQWQDAMGIHWTGNRKSIAEAIPPAYTRYVGQRFTEWKESGNGR